MNRTVWMMAAVAVVAAGCGRMAGLDAEQGGDELDLVSSESALTSDQLVAEDAVASGGKCTELSPEALATRAAAKAPERFSPSSCVTATASGATVTYVLNNCSGRYGWLKASGTFTATFAASGPAGMQVTVVGSGLGANGGSMDINATAVCNRVGNARVFDVNSDVNATGPRGRTVHHVGDYTVKHEIGSQCLSVDGTWTNTSGVFQRVTTVSALTKCAGVCPAAGGQVEVLTARGDTTTIDFDGSAEASWATSRGRSGTVELRCTPAK